jgi:hypothetical protein
VPYARRVAERGQQLDQDLSNAKDDLRNVDQQIRDNRIQQERGLNEEIRGMQSQRDKLAGDVARRERDMAGTEDRLANEEELRDRAFDRQLDASDAAQTARDAGDAREATRMEREAQRWDDEREKHSLAADKLQNQWIRDDDLNTADRAKIDKLDTDLRAKKAQLARGVDPPATLVQQRTQLVSEISRLKTILDNPEVKARRADASQVLRDHAHGYTPRQDEIQRNVERIKDARPGYRWREEHGRVRRGQGFRRRRSRWRA